VHVLAKISGMRRLGMVFWLIVLLPVLILESLEWRFMPFHVRCYLRQNKQNEKMAKTKWLNKTPTGGKIGYGFQRLLS